jgi:phosphoribosylamine---glycine ligase
MKVLFISKDLIAGNLANLLQNEGHEVKMYIDDKDRRQNFTNIVHKVGSIKDGVEWAGKEGLIVFDDSGYGKMQDGLRKKGYTVFGGCEMSDKLEFDREFGQKIFAKYGLKTVTLKDFDDLDDAAVYIKAHPAPWVIKKSCGSTKFVSYVGKLDDGRDTLDLIKAYLNDRATSHLKISLQKRIDGVEIGVGRYFNGDKWIGPIEFNIEHNMFMPGDVGPMTSEMGTLAWYSEDEGNKLYLETIAKLEPYLKEIKFKGDFELNCIVSESGPYILEATPRFGSPIIHLHSEIHNSPWGEFLYAIAKGEDYDLDWKKGYGIVLTIAVPPFPYPKKMKENYAYGINIHFKDLPEDEFEHIHFEEVSRRMHSQGQLYISDKRGYILYVTGIADDIQKAQEKVYSIAQRIIIPKVIYRNDIGTSFLKRDQDLLKNWGYL